MHSTRSISKNPRNAILAAVTVVGVSVVALFLVEVYLRITGFEYELRVHVVEATAPEADQVYRTFSIDPYLIWVPKQYYERLSHARRGRVDIVFMGDSCTQFGRYDGYLAALIREETGRPIRTANLGVAGWTTHQGLRQIERDLAELRPAVVTIYYGWNDHWLSIGLDDNQVSRITASPLRFIQGFRVGQLITKFWVVLRRETEKPVVRVSEDEFYENLVKIVREAKRLGSIPVLITAPSSHRAGNEPAYLEGRWIANISDLIPLHRRYVEIVRRVGAEQHVLLCDLAADFDRLGDERGELDGYFFADGIHFTDKGSLMAAEFLHACLDQNRALKALDR